MLRSLVRAAASVAALVCFTLPSQAQSNATDLARGLRDNGMPDLALEYLDELATKKLGPEVEAVLPLERARARLELANDEPEKGKRDAMIARARGEFDLFIRTNLTSRHPRLAEASISLARLLSVQAKSMLSDANKIDDDKLRKAAAAKARPVFDDASKRFGQAAAEYAKKVEDGGLTATQKKAVLNDVYQAELDRAINSFQLALTYDPPEGLPEVQARGKAIIDAKKFFNDLSAKDPLNSICWVARAWTGECDRELQAGADSEKTFADVKNTKAPSAAAGVRLVKFFEARVGFLQAVGDKNPAAIAKAQSNLEQWLADPAARTRRPAPEVYSARWYIAQCKLIRAQFLFKEDPKTKITTVPPAAMDLLKQAEKDFKRLIEPENDYSGRAAEKHTVVLRRMIGDGDKDPAKILTFEEAMMAAQVQLYRAVKEAKDDAERKKFMVKASALYERVGQLPVPKDGARDLIDAQTNLAYTYLVSDKPMQAAVLAEGLARSTRQAGPGARAGLYGVQAYLQASAKLDPADNEGRRADIARATRLAYYLDKQFPTDPSTDSARVTLGRLLVREQKFVDAFEVASRVQSASPKAPDARLVQGVAAFELLRKVPAEGAADPNAPPPAKKAEIFSRVIVDLQSLPAPAASADGESAHLSAILSIQLVELYLLDKPAGYPKAEVAVKAAQAKIEAFTELTPEEKAELKFKLEHARLRAIYAQAVPLFQKGNFPEVNKRIAPPLSDIAKDGAAAKAGQPEATAAAAKRLDDFRRDSLIVLALQTRIREGAVDKAGELFAMLKSLGGTLDNSVDALGQLIAAARPQIDALKKEGKAEEADKITAGIGLVLDKVAGEKDISPKVLLFLGAGLKDMGNYEKAVEILGKIPVPDEEQLKKKLADLDDKNRLPVKVYRQSRLELARTYRLNKQFTEADATLKDPLGTKEKPGWAATSGDFKREAAYLLEAKGAAAADPKEATKFWAEAKGKWTELANEQLPTLRKLGAGKKDSRSAFIALLDLKQLPPDKNLPEKSAKPGEKAELDEKEIRAVLANSKPSPKQQWLEKLLTEKELGEDGKPLKGADGKELPPPYVVQLQNTVTRLESQIKPTYHELFYESVRCITAANAQILKDKPTELNVKFASSAKQIHSLYEANPDVSAENKEKLEGLMNEYPGVRQEFVKLGEVKSVAAKGPPESADPNAATDPAKGDEAKAAALPPPQKADSSGLIIGAVVGVICLAGVGGFVLFGRKKKAPARRGPPSMVLDAE